MQMMVDTEPRHTFEHRSTRDAVVQEKVQDVGLARCPVVP
jgi:hypothetical protein